MTDSSCNPKPSVPPLIDPDMATKYAVHEAAREGDTASLEAHLKQNPAVAYRADEDGRLPIHWAAAYSQLEVVTVLVNHPKFNVNVQDSLGWTPLMISCSTKDGAEVTKLLLDRDALVGEQNNAGQTALHFACSKSALAVKLLLEHKAPVNTSDRLRRLPIHRAASIGSVEILAALIKAGAALNRTDADGLTALHHAIAEGHVEAAVFLVSKGADTDRLTSDNKLPIQMTNDPAVLEELSERAKEESVKFTLPKGI